MIAPTRLSADRRYDDLAELTAHATARRDPFYAIGRKYCRGGAKVLDIGAGNGEFARPLGDCQVFLMDGNPETVAALSRSFAHTVLHRVPEAFPFEADQFDVIHCSHLVEHLAPPEVYLLMKEMDRCLAPGGHLVISAPLLWSGFYDDLSHVRPYPPAVFRNYLCGPFVGTRTRAVISTAYEVVELHYRHALEAPSYWNVSHARTWAKRVLMRVVNWLRDRHVARYQPSGYTLVLKKQERS